MSDTTPTGTPDDAADRQDNLTVEDAGTTTDPAELAGSSDASGPSDFPTSDDGDAFSG